MFVIPCKFTQKTPFVIQLVESIRKFHPTEKIVVVDSSSNDQSYFDLLKPFDVSIIENNHHWMVGAYWTTYKKFPNEDFYYFLHDSMKVKANLDSLKEKNLTTLMYFDRNVGNFNSWGELITQNSKYKYINEGNGLYGIIYFCKNEVMEIMLKMGADKFLPVNKAETGYCEGCYGFFLEDQGYDLKETSLFGDVFEVQSASGKSGLPPHNTSWQHPIEKFYGYNLDKERLV